MKRLLCYVLHKPVLFTSKKDVALLFPFSSIRAFFLFGFVYSRFDLTRTRFYPY